MVSSSCKSGDGTGQMAQPWMFMMMMMMMMMISPCFFEFKFVYFSWHICELYFLLAPTLCNFCCFLVSFLYSRFMHFNFRHIPLCKPTSTKASALIKSQRKGHNISQTLRLRGRRPPTPTWKSALSSKLKKRQCF